jgi:hypothetical protein
MKTTIIATSLALALGTTAAHADDSNNVALVFGGQALCDTAMQNAGRYGDWVIGFWDGLNVAAAKALKASDPNHGPSKIGWTGEGMTDQSIAQAVWAECRSNMHQAVAMATLTVYHRMSDVALQSERASQQP